MRPMPEQTQPLLLSARAPRLQLHERLPALQEPGPRHERRVNVQLRHVIHNDCNLPGGG